MATINALDEQTIGQIAAGEIVERPLSVVKELVENAVDAGARRITIALERGGTSLVEVSDDGVGISAAELPFALARHATSKLKDAADLAAIRTLGFRGEGLASIAAVSRLALHSRTAGVEIGARITSNGEHVGVVEPTAAPIGTRVRVEELFGNVPVRREYLKSPGAEFARVNAWLSTFTLAYPQIAFTLRHDGEQQWSMPATTDVRERLAAVFGRNAAAALLALDPAAGSTLHGTLAGFISSPGHERADRRMQILFVNGRLLRSSLLAGAWNAGYQTFAMIGRQPYGVLFLDLPPDHVDANVHPTKSDVRLRYGNQVADAVRHAIAGTLRTDARARMSTTLGVTGSSEISYSPPQNSDSLAMAFFEGVSDDSTIAETDPERGLRVIAQLDASYIVVTEGRNLLLLDQHAAHERIAYERIVDAAQGSAPSEPLLVPVILELDSAQSERLERVLSLLAQGGLSIEAFGERSYRILATPAGYRARSFDLAGFLADLGEDSPQRDMRERVWASLACHSVTTAGERLGFSEMAHLVNDLQKCRNPMHCPHGRPTMLRLEPDAIARLFKRT